MSGGGKNTTVIIVVAVIAVIAVGVGAYFLGNSAADADGAEARGQTEGEEKAKAEFAEGRPAYAAIFRKGFQAGQAEGQQSGERQGQQRGYDRGTEVGLEQGEQRGQQQGQQQGQSQGVKTGAEEALGNLTWQDGSFYVVRIAKGTAEVPNRVDDRKLMEPNENYHVCTFNPDLICSESVPSSK